VVVDSMTWQRKSHVTLSASGRSTCLYTGSFNSTTPGLKYYFFTTVIVIHSARIKTDTRNNRQTNVGIVGTQLELVETWGSANRLSSVGA